MRFLQLRPLLSQSVLPKLWNTGVTAETVGGSMHEMTEVHVKCESSE